MNSNVLELFSESLDEISADLSRFSRDIEIVAANSSSENETNYVLQLPNPLPITKKIEQLEMEFYQYQCFIRLPKMKHVKVELIQKKFKEILKNHGSCSIKPKHLEDLDTVDETTKVEQCLMDPFKENMLQNLISKDYVIRMGRGLIKTPETSGNNEKKSSAVMPQFLRAIVTGEKLRLCGAFAENTTFLE